MIVVKEYIGHIRNWRALCEELGIDSNLARDEREKQIIVKAYEKWAGEMANHIYGMYAFALYNEDTEEIFCLRDQFGTKPFYYYITDDGRFLCGTSIRKIMGESGFVKELNEDIIFNEELIGYEVYNDKYLGKVVKLMKNKLYDILVIKKNEIENLIPNIEEFVIKIDSKEKKIYIKEIEGLINED